MNERFDAVVVGAGTAGAATAAQLAGQGAHVLLLERRPPERAGARWVNGVPAWTFEAAGRVPPEVGAGRWGDDRAHAFVIEVAHGSARARIPQSPTLHIDMRALVAALQGEAQRAGASLRRGVAIGLELGGTPKAPRARALRWRDPGGRERWAEAPLFVDATGGRAALRALAPVPAWRRLERGIRWCAAAQYQYEIADPAGLDAFLAARGARRGDTVAIVGTDGGFSTLTLFTSPGGDEVGVLTGSLPSDGHASGRAMLTRFEAAQPWLGRRGWGGAGGIALGPLARPLGAVGVALVGEAAGQLYASHGSGVGLGLIGARMLAEAARQHPDPGGAAALAAYDRGFRGAHGGLLTRSLAFFRVSRHLPPRVVGALMRSPLLSAATLEAALAQREPPWWPPRLSPSDRRRRT